LINHIEIISNFSAWLSNKDSPVIARLSRLIEAVTNLSMETAEDFQVYRYYY
jgi:hypothetical protein